MLSKLIFLLAAAFSAVSLRAATPASEQDALLSADFSAAAALFEKKAASDPEAAWKAAAAKLLADQWPKAIAAFAKNLPPNTKVGAFAPRNNFKDAVIQSVDAAKGFTIDLGGASSALGWRVFPPETQIEILKQAFAKPAPEQLHAMLSLLALQDQKDKAIEVFRTLAAAENARDPIEQEVARWIKSREDAKHEAEARAAALKAAQQFFAEKDATKRAALLEALSDAPVTADEIPQYVKMVVPLSYPDQKPGIRDLQKLELPAAAGGKPVEYSLYVPPRYAPSHPYPLIFGLHGGGEGIGSGDDQMKCTAEEIKGIDAIYVCPTSLDLGVAQYWRNPKNEVMLILLAQEMARQFPIDTNRVYLTGYSMGGIGTYFLGPQMADYFAATGPGAGAWCGIHWPVTLNLPIYLLHGKNDLRGKNATDFVYAANADQCLTELKYDHVLRAVNCDHAMLPGEQKKMFEWCLTKKRDPYAKHVIAASPCVKDFMGMSPLARPDRWLAIDEIGPDNLEMEGCEFGGTPRIKHSIKMGTLDANWTAQNQLDVTAKNVKRFRVLLSPALLDFKKPLKITVNGAVVYEAPAKTSVKFLLRYLDERRDPNMVFAGEVSVDLSKQPVK